MAAEIVQKQRKPRGEGRRWQRGQSGNPAGRAPGTRNRATVLAEALFDGEAETLVRKAVTMALDGDPAALRLCISRIMSPRRDRPVRFELPPLATAADASRALASIAAAVAAGEIAPGEAVDLALLVESFRRSLETTELEARLVELETRARDARERPHA